MHNDGSLNHSGYQPPLMNLILVPVTSVGKKIICVRPSPEARLILPHAKVTSSLKLENLAQQIIYDFIRGSIIEKTLQTLGFYVSPSGQDVYLICSAIISNAWKLLSNFTPTEKSSGMAIISTPESNLGGAQYLHAQELAFQHIERPLTLS